MGTWLWGLGRVQKQQGQWCPDELHKKHECVYKSGFLSPCWSQCSCCFCLGKLLQQRLLLVVFPAGAMLVTAEVSQEVVVLSNVLVLINSMGNVSICTVERSSVHLKMCEWSRTRSWCCLTLLLCTPYLINSVAAQGTQETLTGIPTPDNNMIRRRLNEWLITLKH